MSPKEIRGQLGSLFQFFFTLGVMTSYWIDYAVEKHVEPSDRQWQIPIGLQLVPAGILGIGMLFLKESVRWLASKGRHDEALQSLIWVRGGEDTEEVRAEMAEILDGISAEVAATEGVTWRELALSANRYRLFIAITIQICMLPVPWLLSDTDSLGAQCTGNTSLAYCMPLSTLYVIYETNNCRRPPNLRRRRHRSQRQTLHHGLLRRRQGRRMRHLRPLPRRAHRPKVVSRNRRIPHGLSHAHRRNAGQILPI